MFIQLNNSALNLAVKADDSSIAICPSPYKYNKQYFSTKVDMLKRKIKVVELIARGV